MGSVRLWLSVYEHLCPMGTNELWTKLIPTDFAPRAGDHVHISVEADDPLEGGVGWDVRSTYWDHDGSYHAQMSHLVVDPIEAQQQIRNSPDRPPYWRAWWTDTETGRPEPMLRRGGWQTWKEYREEKSR